MAPLKILTLVVAAICISFALYWSWQIAGCLARKDFKPVDKFFWFAVLLIPGIGLLLYRGFARVFYKKQNRGG